MYIHLISTNLIYIKIYIIRIFILIFSNKKKYIYIIYVCGYKMYIHCIIHTGYYLHIMKKRCVYSFYRGYMGNTWYRTVTQKFQPRRVIASYKRMSDTRVLAKRNLRGQQCVKRTCPSAKESRIVFRSR